jgi:N-acetylglucosaminyl-diphospho-decaprenol L-rhamnosyltransferase
MTPQTTVLLVTFNSADVLAGALASLPPGMPAIVADNASTDNSAAIADAAGARVIRLPRNEGFGRANNAGLALARTPYVLLMNPDARLRPGCLDLLVAAADGNPDAGLVVPAIFKADGSRFEKWSSMISVPAFRARAQATPGIRDIPFASGAVVLARRDLLERLGGFDPDIFLYFEDDDLSRRVLDAGFRILLADGAQADHAGNTSSPPSPAMTAVKSWHRAWSERHVRQKFKLGPPGYWRVGESLVKMLWAQMRRDRLEHAKQMGIVNGTLGHMRGLRAQDVRDTLRTERE